MERERAALVVYNSGDNVLARHPIADDRLASANHSAMWQQRYDACVSWLNALRVDMPHRH